MQSKVIGFNLSVTRGSLGASWIVLGVRRERRMVLGGL